MISEIGAALHVVDARRIPAPRRTRQDVIAATGMSCDALDGGREIAIALGDHGRELVDLPGCFRRRFDLDPAADAVEDGSGIEGIGGRQHVVYLSSSFRDASPGAGPESILPIAVMDSGLARFTRAPE